MVKPPKEVIQEGIQHWDSCLVGQIFRKNPKYSLVYNVANMLWGRDGSVEVMAADKDFGVFKFPNNRTRDWVLEEGPWHIANQTLALIRWKPNMQLIKPAATKIPIWVKFWHVPMEYMTRMGLSYLASAIGVPLYMDKATERGNRFTFAKVWC